VNALLLSLLLVGIVTGAVILNGLFGIADRRRIRRRETAERYLQAHDVRHVEIMEDGRQIQHAAQQLEICATQVTASGEDREALNKEADWLENYCRQFTDDVRGQLKADHKALKRFPKGYGTTICPKRHSEWDEVHNFAYQLHYDLALRHIHR
jgi:hypothetical protein